MFARLNHSKLASAAQGYTEPEFFEGMGLVCTLGLTEQVWTVGAAWLSAVQGLSGRFELGIMAVPFGIALCNDQRIVCKV